MSVVKTAPTSALTVKGGKPPRSRLGKSAKTANKLNTLGLLVPALALLLLCFIGPLALMAAQSLAEGVGTYQDVLTSEAIRKVFGNTIRIALLTTSLCLLLGYPYAYAIRRSGRTVRLILTALVMMPFWVSVLTRTFAWVGLLQDTGVINSFLMSQGWISAPLELIRTPWGVLIGMVHVLLPYMVISLMNAMSSIDSRLLQAAESLGASPLQRFVRVHLPLSVPGITAGCVLVFVMALGFYITPAMLGSPSDMMVAELLVQETQRIGTVRASAIGILLLVGMVLSFLFVQALQKLPSATKGGK